MECVYLYKRQRMESTFYAIEMTIIAISCTETKCSYNYDTKGLVE